MSDSTSKCGKCEKSLAGQKYVDYEDKHYCLNCYEEHFTNTCQLCQQKIKADSKDLAFKEFHWHGECFSCVECKNSLVEKSFLMKDNSIYCQECHENKFSQRCDACNGLFKGGQKKYEYKGKTLHNECFACSECKEPIGTKSFVPKDEQIICITCFDEKYTKKCFKCKSPIKDSGITYKGETYHKACFLCTNCNKELAGQKFTTREEKAFCIDCFSEMFAQKCELCLQPITGLGGTKFITFENKNWHSDCFKCSKCSVSLVDKGFSLKEKDVLCGDCNK